MKTLPPPPVPQKLREILKDYPQYLNELQRSINDVTARPLNGTPLFEQAIWSLEGALDSFYAEACNELRAAESSGVPEIIRTAQEKERLIRHASSKNRGMSNLNDLWAYFEANKALLP